MDWNLVSSAVIAMAPLAPEAIFHSVQNKSSKFVYFFSIIEFCIVKVTMPPRSDPPGRPTIQGGGDRSPKVRKNDHRIEKGKSKHFSRGALSAMRKRNEI